MKINFKLVTNSIGKSLYFINLQQRLKISIISRRNYWALTKENCSKSIIVLRSNELQALENFSSEKRRSNFAANLSTFFLSSFILADMLLKLKSSSINCSLDNAFSLLLVTTMAGNSYTCSMKNIIYLNSSWLKGVFTIRWTSAKKLDWIGMLLDG